MIRRLTAFSRTFFQMPMASALRFTQKCEIFQWLRQYLRRAVASVSVLSMAVSLMACSEEEQAVTECVFPASWAIEVPGSGVGERDPASQFIDQTTFLGGPLTGLSQPIVGREIVHRFEVPDLGENGSITLSARTRGFPEELVGSAYPFLVELHDGARDVINLKRSGNAGDCAQSGIFSCSNGNCTVNSGCSLNSPSAFQDRSHWQQYQLPPFGYTSTNTFPTCFWDTGSPNCAYNDQFFDQGKLRTGSYTAKYVLLTSNYSSVGNFIAQIEVRTLMKMDPDYAPSGPNGAIDINLIAVGQANRNALNTPSVQNNFSQIMQSVQDHWNQDRPGLKLGNIRSYEWTCPDSGELFASIDLEEIDAILSEGSRALIGSEDARAVNVFLVSDIPSRSNRSTILGVSGAILGPSLNGTGTSGVVVATNDQLESMTSGSRTARTFSETITHEVGHFLGLNHLSEREGTMHDYLTDTPECPASGGEVTHQSCRSVSSCGALCTGTVCPTVAACQFNHAMWYRTKVYDSGSSQGDGNLFSEQSSRVINFSPMAR